MRIAAFVVVLIAVGCGGSSNASERPDTYSASEVVACLRDDEGLLIPVDDVLEDPHSGFTVDEPVHNMSLRLDEEDEPRIRGDFTMVTWYGEEPASGGDSELSKVQLYFTATEADGQVLHEEHAANARNGGATEADVRRVLERRENVILAWDEGSTDAMRAQIDRCLR